MIFSDGDGKQYDMDTYVYTIFWLERFLRRAV